MIILKRIKNIINYRGVLLDMSMRQFKMKYSGSMLGVWWAVIIPLVLAASINFIFIKVFKVNTANFTLFILSGIIPWLFFSNALSEVTNIFTVNSLLLKQIIFPREIIPFSSVIANFLNFIIGFVCLFPLFIMLKIKVIILLPFLILILILNLVFILGLGVFFSVLNVFFRDVSYFLSIGLMIWFWITPVFYSIDMVPLPYRSIFLLNPVTYFMIFYRNVLFDGIIPSLLTIIITFLSSCLFFVLGYLFFLKNETNLLKKI